MEYATDKIRTVTVAGHGQTGKTTLVERLLFGAGVIQRPETIESGKTTSDFTPEEIDRKISIYASLVHLPWKETLINIWDTPGSSDFSGEVITAFRASELAVILIDARQGVQIETIKLWRNLDRRNKARVLFVNYLDDDRADFEKSVQDVHSQFEADVCPVTIPMGSGSSFRGVINVLTGKAYEVVDDKETEVPIPEEFTAEYERAREVLAGAAAEGDDDLLVKFIDEAGLSDEDMIRGLKLAIKDNRIVPAFCGCAVTGEGTASLLDFIAAIAPSPAHALEVSLAEDDSKATVKINPDGPVSAIVLKISNDQFSGKLAYIKVITGKLSADSEIFNVSENKKEKIGKLFPCSWKKTR